MYSQRNQVEGGMLLTFLGIPLLLHKTSEDEFTAIWQTET